MTPTAPTAHKTQFASLQILRAVAALGVFFFHYFTALKDDFHLFDANPFPLGAFGVDIFFVISGFIICHAASSETSSARFSIKRLCRILPLYYLLTLGVFLIALAAPGLLNSTTANPEHLAKSLLFVPYVRDNGTVQPLLFLGWTLNFEMFFYAVFAFAIFLGRMRYAVTIGFIALLVAIGYILKPEGTIAAFYTSGIMLNFVWGCLAYFVWKKWPGIVRGMRHFWPVPVALLFIQNFIPIDLPREFAYGLPATLLLLSVLTIPVGRGLLRDFFVRLGDASYSLYLIHPYILQAAVKVVLPVLGVGAASVGAVSIIAVVSTLIASMMLFAFLERPSNTWLRRKLLKARSPKPAPI